MYVKTQNKIATTGRIRAIEITQRFVLYLTGLVFVSMSTGLLLDLHLHSLDHPESHDSHDCSICKHLLLGPQKFTFQIAADFQVDQAVEYMSCSIESTVPLPAVSGTFRIRPPPFHRTS